MGLRTWAVVIPLLLGPQATVAQESPAAESAPGPAESSRPRLDLERLLRVPKLPPPAQELYGGKDRSTWQSAFSSARGEVSALEKTLDEKQQELREAAPQEWGFSPTGTGAPTDPEVLRLRAEIRRDKQSLEAAQKRLRELEVEASLAGVPTEWTAPADVEPSTAD